MRSRNYFENYLSGAKTVIDLLHRSEFEKTLSILIRIKKNKGRLFLIGLGGGAANASHAVNDFRKICGIESYTPTDNVAEITARINDDGWRTVFVNWLKVSRICANDALMVFSVGGGNIKKNISVNIVEALKYAKRKKAKIMGIVGRDGGFTRKIADVTIIIPTVNRSSVTAYTEAFQAVIWHAIVNHPHLKE